MPSLFEVVNMEEVLSHMDAKNLLGEPLRRHWERVCLDIEGQARQRAPVDTGLLRASFTHDIDTADIPVQAVVGSPTQYAPFMEWGTGRQGDPAAPYAHKDRHWPPGDALDLWASRHGLASGWSVAAAIGRRGGLKARHFLTDALASAASRMGEFFDKLTSEIGTNWSNE